MEFVKNPRVKIYTKTGDEGQTSLFTGKRVLKTNPWISLYGGLDELNSAIGLLSASLTLESTTKPQTPLKSDLDSELSAIQSVLFSLGSYYASEATESKHIKDLGVWTKDLESSMDQLSEPLPPLKNFILPGGSFEASLAHQVRVKVRAVERKAVELALDSVLKTLPYLNRLSDYFFVLARHLNFKRGKKDRVWMSQRPSSQEETSS